MSRVIHTTNLATDRHRLMKAMAIAARELAAQPSFANEARDLAAFIVLILEEISSSIERSVGPWEKRGYWVKADRFRMEWGWVSALAMRMRAALLDEDAAALAQSMVSLGERLREIKVPKKHRLGTPWIGAWKKLDTKSQMS